MDKLAAVMLVCVAVLIVLALAGLLDETLQLITIITTTDIGG